ncbi:MAG: HAMP domain-containing histidine kinase [Candidatus Magnetoovum sp. WYHC-5]|nr:HAMP domain-containing histidine kinase [Candidatus Magnetoovum sp. WYHC-5]
MDNSLLNLINELKKRFPKEPRINLFTSFLEGCTSSYGVNQCSVVTPNYDEGKWQFVTGFPYSFYSSSEIIKAMEYEIDYLSSNLKDNCNMDIDFWQHVKQGICNATLYTKSTIAIDNVHNTIYKYVNINDSVNHEIAIPLIIKGQVVNCIILDFYSLENYNQLKEDIIKIENMEGLLSGVFSEYIYTHTEKLWNNAYIKLSRLKKINLDDEEDSRKLNNTLSNLWPGLKYYSIWANTTNLNLQQQGKGFVQIGANFSEDKKNLEILEDTHSKYIDYVFTDTDDITYTELLRESINRFTNSNGDDKALVQSTRITRDTYKPIHNHWLEILFNGETMFDLHFIPLTDIIEEGGKEKLIIGSIFIYFFDCLGNPQVIKEEKVELLSRLIYEKIKHERTIKIEKFLSRIYQITSNNIKQTGKSIEQIAIELLNTIRCELIDIWIIGQKGITSYIYKYGWPNPIKSIIEDNLLATTKESCFNRGAPYPKIAKITPHGLKDNCLDFLIAKYLQKYQFIIKSWMLINVSGMQGGDEKAMMFFYNRIHNRRIKAFSEYDRLFAEEIAKDLGILLSIYDLWEKEENLKAALPHEIMSPIGNLVMGLKTIEGQTDELFLQSNINDNSLFKSLKDNIHECLTILYTIKTSTNNYIRFLKHDTKNIQKKQLSINTMLENLRDSVLYKFTQSKYVYIALTSAEIITKANESMLFSVINNIFDNAFKYCNEYSIFNIIATQTYNTITISFTSYGNGLEAGELTRVFNLNYQGKNVKKEEYEYWKGKGIGLTLSKFLIEDCHGGKIYFKKSDYICSYNPFYLYLMNALVKHYNIKDYSLPQCIMQYFNDAQIKGFFLNLAKEEKMTPNAINYYLNQKTFENEIVVELPKL